MSQIEFRPVDFSNLDKIVDLEVQSAQKHLVADNAYSVAQALLDPVGDCRAIYFENIPIGFYYIRSEDSSIYICRFMIDYRWQGKSFGKKAIAKLLDTAFSSERIVMVDLAVSRELGNSEDFYRKCGFVSTGEIYKGGFRMIFPRNKYFSISAEQGAAANP